MERLGYLLHHLYM